MKSISILFVLAAVLTACADRDDPVYPPSEGRIQFERNSEFDGETLRTFLTLQDGTPRLVAGFNDASFEESDGSNGVFVGSFLGLSGPFKETGVSRRPDGGGG